MTRPFRRRVLYIPGYDPIPPRRYRELYRREGAAQARISGYGLNIGPRRDPTGFGWGAAGDFPQGRAQADIKVLAWADVVQGSMGRSIPATHAQLARTAWTCAASGALCGAAGVAIPPGPDAALVCRALRLSRGAADPVPVARLTVRGRDGIRIRLERRQSRRQRS